mmetsp:Transcript_15499/g.20365  ORF Transcript_15499/g.20365 Transcript_15499/m.20365 type:complete len:530 (+) Transcript_15499:1498-3087(+)|eukprot:CAMPEP_0184012196 /NCGR_PEP_ID=MMETSP0954-20121128/4264_1 /TAXON_ID=627963 /ORGANISM="Aplanochytrium sp, Strain PBS07" /LENGTH=529 /DNA_ID=CAMNT_0026292129 /DNA_START=1490 /DNA_END=3079 /DNA_ORIENTATION=+
MQAHHEAVRRFEPPPGPPGSNNVGQKDILEEYTAHCCEVNGKIPEYIFGTLYKQSGGAFKEGTDFLEGLAHITAFRLENGQAKFTNKYMRTQEFADFMNKGERHWQGTAAAIEQPSRSSQILSAIKSLFGLNRKAIVPSKDIMYDAANPNVNVVVLNKGQVTAANTEADGTICVFDSDTLETKPSLKTMHPFQGKGMILTNAAHYFCEKGLGGYHAAVEMSWGMDFFQPRFKFTYTIFHGDEAPYKSVFRQEVASFKYSDRKTQPTDKRIAYQHTIARTQNYLVTILGSHRLDYDKLLKKDFSRGFFGLFPQVDHPVEFMVFKVENDGGVQLVDTLATNVKGMVWHMSNAFEDDDGRIVLDASMGSIAETEGGVDKSSLMRFNLDLQNKSAAAKYLLTGETSYEFPNINYRFHQKPYLYSYVLANAYEETSYIAKGNVVEGTEEQLQLPEHWIPSEPVFVPNPEGKSEDDGAILTVAVDTKKSESHLVIADGTTLEIMATVKAPVVCNFGLHCTFVPGQKEFMNVVSKY